MKKIIISAAILLLTGATAFAVNHYQKSINDNFDPLTKANIEAMRTITLPSTDIGTSTGGRIICFSSSRALSGATYYDCGDCSRQFNSRGYGQSSTCLK